MINLGPPDGISEAYAREIADAVVAIEKSPSI